MSLPPLLRDHLRLPVIGAPMFIVSGPELVLAQCKAGIVGSFPALNARPEAMLETWLERISKELRDHQAQHPGAKVAPYAVNQIVHSSNVRLQHDLDLCVKHRVPIMITSLRPPLEIVQAAHSYGGLVFHDVINVKHARKAAEQGVDGIVAVCAGAGGHAGTTSPFALVREIRQFYGGAIILSGAITSGADVLAAEAIGIGPDTAIVHIPRLSLGAGAADRLAIKRIAAALTFEQSLQQVLRAASPFAAAQPILGELFAHANKHFGRDDRGNRDRDLFGRGGVVG